MELCVGGGRGQQERVFAFKQRYVGQRVLEGQKKKKRVGADRIGSKLDSGQATNPVLGLKGVGQIQYL